MHPPTTFITALVALTLTQAPTVLAWGAYGHETVAYIATNFVATSTKSYFQSVLGDTSTDYLASVAAWADSYRATTAGKFSAPYHFIDAQDNPPSSCGVVYSRDCGAGGCVVGAISNYTNQLLSSKTTSANKLIAAKMVIHFLGDIGQPLHCENLDVGGNSIAVTYSSASSNLHAIWDTQIPEQISGGSTLADAKTWAANLTTAIKTGTYKTASANWSTSINITDAIGSATTWATESNAQVCQTVLAKGISYVENNDLSGTYTTTAAPVVASQIAKQGYRLAKWLDAIAASAPAKRSLSHGDVNVNDRDLHNILAPGWCSRG